MYLRHSWFGLSPGKPRNCPRVSRDTGRNMAARKKSRARKKGKQIGNFIHKDSVGEEFVSKTLTKGKTRPLHLSFQSSDSKMVTRSQKQATLTSAVEGSDLRKHSQKGVTHLHLHSSNQSERRKDSEETPAFSPALSNSTTEEHLPLTDTRAQGYMRRPPPLLIHPVSRHR